MANFIYVPTIQILNLKKMPKRHKKKKNKIIGVLYLFL